jgi:hypothetical protein
MTGNKPIQSLPPIDPLRRYSVNDSLQYLGISRAPFYQNVAEGKIKIIKDRKRTFVPGSELVRLSSAST